MFFTKVFIAFTCAAVTRGMNCTQDNYYVADQADLNNLENCTTIDGNLIINTGFSVNNFQALGNLETVTGYLFIFDNHNVSSLYGFHNLLEVEGNELYLGTYSVAIKYNRNEFNNTHDGLCYTNTVNWTTITSDPVDIRFNGLNCPECHPQCDGCFGPGPAACQGCSNFDYAGICVQICPENYTNFTCDEVMPSPPSLEGSIVGLNNVFLSWNLTNINDFVSGYNVYIDDVLNYSYVVSDLGYYYDDLSFNHSFNGLEFETNYSFEVSFVNHLGESNRSNVVYLMTEPRPSTTSTTTTTTTTSTVSTLTSVTTTSTLTTPTVTSTTSTLTGTTLTSTTLSTISTPTTSVTTTPTSTVTTNVNTTVSVDTANEHNNKTPKGWWNNLYLIPIILFVAIVCVALWIYYEKGDKSQMRVVPAEESTTHNAVYAYGNTGHKGFETSNDYSVLEREQTGRVKQNPVYDC